MGNSRDNRRARRAQRRLAEDVRAGVVADLRAASNQLPDPTSTAEDGQGRGASGRIVRVLDALLEFSVLAVAAIHFLPDWIDEVIAGWITLSVAWLGGVILLIKHAQRGVALVGSVVLSIALLVAGTQVRPTPSLTGAMEGPRNPVVGRIPQSMYPYPVLRFMIGDSGSAFGWNSSDPAIQMFFEKNGLVLEIVDGRIAVSAMVRDRDGTPIAEIIRNEWKIAGEGSWDRNYSDDALEIRDKFGAVIFQMYTSERDVHIQGEWWRRNDSPGVSQDGVEIKGIRIVSVGRGKGAFVIPNPTRDTPEIRPIFKYPGDLHLGELISDESPIERIMR